MLHDAARAALEAGEPGIPAHAALETYSVLTRLPPPHRAHAGAVVEFLEDTFGDKFFALPEPEFHGFVSHLARDDIQGGATYDALIAAVAMHRGTELLTCDERAARTYERCGAQVEFLR